ncbi:Regulator of Vps4 activity in the MVB pathway protein [Heracleum sosnowskyi]|uniref:Regulator of Vps4 activity in the MVB pathway protein n=1 Tax=Heracleum sosnowskyi TaxID=360622 RepID=A0AAD8HW47_9APIA|nr:Regulator of Vps4 activity in the MVB pathway protein [Heracleum sosnowskyi]
MGRHIDALLGRNTFKASKLRPIVSLAISRLAIFKNQRQARSNIARSDVVQLLNLGHHQRAFLRVEQVIKEQNMLEVFVMIEGYCHILKERAGLIVNQKVCPNDLDEAISSLIYAATKCGEFPELQKIRSILTSWFGNEFALQAIELSNKTGSNRKIVQMLSTRQPSLDKKLKLLKDIASENGISVENEEISFIVKQAKLAVERKSNRPKVERQQKSGMSKINDNCLILPEDTEKVKNLSDSVKGRLYRDVADAAQEAFESAAYAAVAARAAVELSRTESLDPDNKISPESQSGKVLNARDSMNTRQQTSWEIYLSETEDMNIVLTSENFPQIQSCQSIDDDDEIHMTSMDNMFKQQKDVSVIKRSVSNISSESSLDSGENIQSATSSPKINVRTIAFNPSDDEKYS